MKKEEIFCAHPSCHSTSGRKLFDSQSRIPVPLIHQTIEEENEALRSKNHILEEKLKFYEREYQLKQQTLEKRLTNITSSCTSLTQQKTALQLQLQQVLSQINQYQQAYQQLEQENWALKNDLKRINDTVNRQSSEIERLTAIQSKYKSDYKQKKQKLRQQNEEVNELKTQLIQFEHQTSQVLQQKAQELEESNRINEQLQKELQDLRAHYEQLVENCRKHFEGQQIHPEQSSPDVEKVFSENIQLRMDLENVCHDFEQLREQVNLNQSNSTQGLEILIRLLNGENITYDLSKYPQIDRIKYEVDMIKQKYNKQKEKKKQIKGKLKILTTAQRTTTEKESGQKFSTQVKQYQNNNLSEINQRRSDSVQNFQICDHERQITRMKRIMKLLYQFINEFIQQRMSLKELNLQLSEIAQDSKADISNQNFDAGYLNKFRVCVYSVIAVQRLRKQAKFPNQIVIFKKFNAESIRFQNVNHFFEMLTVQQQLIQALQNKVFELEGLHDEYENQKQLYEDKIIELSHMITQQRQVTEQSGINSEEIEVIKELVARELQREISGVKEELDQYKLILAENQRQREEEVGKKDIEIEEIFQENLKLKNELILQNNYCAQLRTLNDALQVQLKSVRDYEDRYTSEKSNGPITRNRLGSDQNISEDCRSQKSRNSGYNEVSRSEILLNTQEQKVKAIEIEFRQMIDLIDHLRRVHDDIK